MLDPLTSETLARMKAEHWETADGDCLTCKTEPYWGEVRKVPFPCDTALLLAELERVMTAKWWEAFPAYVEPDVVLPPGFEQASSCSGTMRWAEEA